MLCKRGNCFVPQRVIEKHKRKTAASNKGDIEAGPVAGKLDYQDEAEAVNNEKFSEKGSTGSVDFPENVKYFSGEI